MWAALPSGESIFKALSPQDATLEYCSGSILFDSRPSWIKRIVLNALLRLLKKASKYPHILLSRLGLGAAIYQFEMGVLLKVWAGTGFRGSFTHRGGIHLPLATMEKSD
jgi:hypothetical protein